MKVKEIKSADNPIFKGLLKLGRARGIKKQGNALISGARNVKEVLEEFPELIEYLLFTEEHDLSTLHMKDGASPLLLESDLFRRIDFHKTKFPLLVVRVGGFEKWVDTEPPPGCTLCLPFQDPANVGAVIRTAAAFGVSRVVLLQEAANPFLPKSARSAGSALFRIPLLEGPQLKDLRVTTTPMVTLSPVGTDISGYSFPKSFYLVPGMEGPGLPDHLESPQALRIPMENNVESINAALATGIALYLWSRGV